MVRERNPRYLNRTRLSKIVGEVLELKQDSHGRYLQARKIVDAFVEAITKGIQNEGQLQIYGIGTFKVVTKPAKKILYPFIGYGAVRSPDARINPEYKVVEFFPSMDIMAELNKQTPNYNERKSLRRKSMREANDRK